MVKILSFTKRWNFPTIFHLMMKIFLLYPKKPAVSALSLSKTFTLCRYHSKYFTLVCENQDVVTRARLIKVDLLAKLCYFASKSIPFIKIINPLYIVLHCVAACSFRITFPLFFVSRFRTIS